MKSFRIYLPGGGVPTAPGLVVIAIAVMVMMVGFVKIEYIARQIPNVTLLQLKQIFILSGLAVVATGWVVLKILGIPFAKKAQVRSSNLPHVR